MFYDRLFEKEPDAKELFAEDMSEQKKALLALLNRVVGRLRDTDILVPVVKGLGIKQARLGVDAEIYPRVNQALLWTLQQKLENDWSSDLRNAWSAAFEMVSKTMMEAANEHLEAEAESERKEAERQAAKDAETAAKAEAEAEAAEYAQEEEKVSAMAEEQALEAARKDEEAASKKKSKSRSASGTFGAMKDAEQKNKVKEQITGPQRQLVVFNLDTELYGLDIGSVREIIRLQEITDIPRTPDFVEGVINLRGKVIPVVDLRKRFGMDDVERDEDFRIVVVDVNGNEIGMIVDAVTEVSRVPENGIEPPSSVIAAQDADYLTGIAKTHNDMIILLDIGKLISFRDMQKLAEAVPESTESAEPANNQADQAAA